MLMTMLFLLVIPGMLAELFSLSECQGIAERCNTSSSLIRSLRKRRLKIAADFMTSFYGIQVGALETQEFRAQPAPFLTPRSSAGRFSVPEMEDDAVL
jgi:hypothetical protein